MIVLSLLLSLGVMAQLIPINKIEVNSTDYLKISPNVYRPMCEVWTFQEIMLFNITKLLEDHASSFEEFSVNPDSKVSVLIGGYDYVHPQHDCFIIFNRVDTVTKLCTLETIEIYPWEMQIEDGLLFLTKDYNLDGGVYSYFKQMTVTITVDGLADQLILRRFVNMTELEFINNFPIEYYSTNESYAKTCVEFELNVGCVNFPKTTEIVLVSPAFTKSSQDHPSVSHFFSNFNADVCDVSLSINNAKYRGTCRLEGRELTLSNLFNDITSDFNQFNLRICNITRGPMAFMNYPDPRPLEFKLQDFTMQNKKESIPFKAYSFYLTNSEPIVLSAIDYQMERPFNNTITTLSARFAYKYQTMLCEDMMVEITFTNNLNPKTGGNVTLTFNDKTSISNIFNKLNVTSVINIGKVCIDFHQGIQFQISSFLTPLEMGNLNVTLQFKDTESKQPITEKITVQFKLIDEMKTAWIFEPVNRRLAAKTSIRVRALLPKLGKESIRANMVIQVDPAYPLAQSVKIEPLPQTVFGSFHLISERNEIRFDNATFEPASNIGHFFGFDLKEATNIISKTEEISAKLTVTQNDGSILWMGSTFFNLDRLKFNNVTATVTLNPDQSFKTRIEFVSDSFISFHHTFYLQIPEVWKPENRNTMDFKTNLLGSDLSFNLTTINSTQYLIYEDLLLNATSNRVNFIELALNSSTSYLKNGEVLQMMITPGRLNDSNVSISNRLTINAQVSNCPLNCEECLFGQTFPLSCNKCITGLVVSSNQKACEDPRPPIPESKNSTNSTTDPRNKLNEYLQMNATQLSAKIYKAIAWNALFISFASGCILKLFYGVEFVLLAFLACTLSVAFNVLVYVLSVNIITSNWQNGLLYNIPNFVFVISNLLVSLVIYLKGKKQAVGPTNFKMMSIQSNSLVYYLIYGLLSWGTSLWMLIFGEPMFYLESRAPWSGRTNFKLFINRVIIISGFLLAGTVLPQIVILFLLTSTDMTIKLMHTMFAGLLMASYVFLFASRTKKERLKSSLPNRTFYPGSDEKDLRDAPDEFRGPVSPPSEDSETMMALTEGDDYLPIRNVLSQMRALRYERLDSP